MFGGFKCIMDLGLMNVGKFIWYMKYIQHSELNH